MSNLIRKSKKGFTLIELMIVVAIIGILAAIAIPNFLRFQLKAKSSEGKVNIAAIRTAEESYLAEFGRYVAAAQSPAVTAIDTTKTAFVDVGTGAANFDELGWGPEGLVYFSYGVAYTSGQDVYSISATANIDGDATNQAWGYIKSGSDTSVAAPIATCAATGVLIGGVATFDTVGPCATGHGQSIF